MKKRITLSLSIFISVIFISLAVQPKNTSAQTPMDCATVIGIPPSECEVLVALYINTNGDSWTNNANWLVTNSPSEWFGVTVSEGNVTALILEGNNLTGNIPNELGTLSNLLDLRLYNNNLSGNIPAELGNLTNLKTLSLANNNLSGGIPPELGNLNNLEMLRLSDNKLSGGIPPGIGSLSKLLDLWLYNNNLSGNIPAELGNLAGLKYLALSNNQLSGPIPSVLGNLSSLASLGLSSNQLSGEIPIEIGNLTGLTVLGLGHNQLGGEIPIEIGNLTGLTHLDLSHNQLSGEIPVEIGNLTGLISLLLQYNQLSGSIPSQIGNLTSLVSLWLGYNQFNGEIPSEIGSLTNLGSLMLNGNQLSGKITPTIGNLASLTSLDVSGNQLGGEIPSQITSLTALSDTNLGYNHLFSTNTEVRDFLAVKDPDWEASQTYSCIDGMISQLECEALEALYHSTDGDNWINRSNWLVKHPDTWFGVTVSEGHVTQLQLSGNNLKGTIPSAIGDLTYLIRLTLHSNQLSGVIPAEIGNLTGLTVELNLASNLLSGSIPPTLGNLTNLTALSLAFNQLSGSIPPMLGNLNNLTSLTLHRNQLDGSIPPEIGNLASLEIIWLMNNALNGYIPATFGNLSNLENMDLSFNQLSGSIPPELGSLSKLVQLNLRHNQFSGGIPTTIGNLSNLTYLDLGFNQLSGSIPLELGTLTKLNHLLLFSNQLSGNIPTQLGNLTALSSLNLASNQLGGNIPTQLGNLTSLAYLSLDRNQLVGEIPAELGNLKNIIKLQLNNNQLTGGIPMFEGFTRLDVLFLNNNQLSGSIPAELGNLSKMFWLDLSSNQLSGSIPPELGELGLLSELSLYNNQLSGSIPPEFGNLASLGSLHIFMNPLSGALPHELTQLTALRVLSFSNTELCEPPDPDFQTWLDGLQVLNSTDVICTLQQELIFVVNTPDDPGDSQCLNESCSLRAAIIAANDHPGQNSIHFNLPVPGSFIISPTSPLPAITEAVIIDGYTQPGSSANTQAVGSDAVILIELNGDLCTDGTAANNLCQGLVITPEGAGSMIQGLAIHGNFNHGIFIDQGQIGPSDNFEGLNTIQGNFIGLQPDGAADGLAGAGVFIHESSRNLIGGPEPAARNIISANLNGVSVIASSIPGIDNKIWGNYIGTNPAGTDRRGNTEYGVSLEDLSQDGCLLYDNSIGWSNDNTGNLISANGTGVALIGNGGDSCPHVFPNWISGNFIGTNAFGDAATDLGNTAYGVLIEGMSRSLVGGFGFFSTDGQPNLIAYNGADGVYIASGLSNVPFRNAIHSNAGLGIRLGDGANNNMNAPVLINAIEVDNNVSVHGFLAGQPGNTEYFIQFYASQTCDPSTFGEGQAYLDFGIVTTDNDAELPEFQHTAEISSELPEVPLLTVPEGYKFITATATDPVGNTSGFSKCVPVDFDNTSWTNALEINAASGFTQSTNADTDISQFINLPGQSRWYKVNLQPGTQVVIDLTDLPASYDLMVFTDIDAVYQQSTNDSPQDQILQLAELEASALNPSTQSPDLLDPQRANPEAYSLDSLSTEKFSNTVFAPYAFSPYAFSPYAFSPYAFSPYAFSPYAFSPYAFSPYAFSPYAFSPYAFSPYAFSDYANAQQRSLIAVVSQDGTGDRNYSFNSWNNQGDYYIRVFGRNGAHNLDAPYNLSVDLSATECVFVNPNTLSATSIPAPTNGIEYTTLVLVDFTRLNGTEAEMELLQDALTNFLARPEVNGVLIDVGMDARVMQANGMADQYPDCPYAKNLVAESIKKIINLYGASNPLLKYIVLLGNDEVIPFYRYPDQSPLGNEVKFVPPLTDLTASNASLKMNYFLSQDAYGSSLELSQQASAMPVPELAVGRLVEKPAEITNMLNAYLNTGEGVVSLPASALVTGYDFQSPGSIQVLSELIKGMTSPNSVPIIDSLINQIETSPNGSWTADELRTKLFAESYDIVYLAAHFRDSGILAADYQTQILASELADVTIDMENSIIISAGCHSGYNTVDSAVIPGVTLEPDWAQALAQKGATLIGGTGYQYGDTDFIAYSQQLYLDFVKQLRTGMGPVSLGDALVAAKLQYLKSKPSLVGIDQKSMMIPTLYGLPMLKVDMPGERILPPGASCSLNPVSIANGPGNTFGLSWANTTFNPITLIEQQKILEVAGSTETYTATYYTGADGVLTYPGEPVLPLETENVCASGQILSGVGFMGGTYTDISGILPLVGAATTELRGVHVPFLTAVFYPNQPWGVNYFGALTDPANGSTDLMVTPAQYKSSTPGSMDGTMRLFSNMDFRLYYYDPSIFANNPDLKMHFQTGSPTITQVIAIANDSTISFQAHVTGDPRVGIQQVWVTYTNTTNQNNGEWVSLELQQNINDSTLWEGELIDITKPADIRYMVQAVNGVGLVALNTNQGNYFTPNIDPGAPPAPLPGEPEPSETTLTFIDLLSSAFFNSQITFKVKLESSGIALPDRLLVFSLGSTKRYGTSDGNGEASFTLWLLDEPGAYNAKVDFSGAEGFLPTSTSTGFTINPQNTSLILSPSQTANQDIPIVATLTDENGYPMREQTVLFVITPIQPPGPDIYISSVTNVLGQAYPADVPELETYFYDVAAYTGGEIAAAIGLPQDPNSNATYSSTFAFPKISGFYPPVENQPINNSVKAGRSIPIKFSLDGDYGLEIFAVGSPSVDEIACNPTSPVDTIYQYATDTKSSLNYDANADQYIYIWKTDSNWEGKCFRLEIKLINGNTKSADFIFK